MYTRTHVMLHIADREWGRGQFKPQSIQVMDRNGVIEALPLQVALGHLASLHCHQDLMATLKHSRHTEFNSYQVGANSKAIM